MRSFLLVSIILMNLWTYGEGSKQIQNPTGNNVKIQIGTDQINNFCTYSSAPDKKIYIHIENPEVEQVFLGFGKHYHVGGDTVSLFFRIKDPSGQVVFPGTLVPTAGKGFIQNFNQTLAGPNGVDSTAEGYDPIVFKPTIRGDYTIEFSHDNTDKDNDLRMNRIVLDFFDVTVASDSVRQDGRLWAYTWSLYTANFQNEAFSKFFVYTPDSAVTRIDLNGLQAYGFAVMANSNGTQTSSSWSESRKSALGNQGYGQYKIFLTDPDATAFPSGKSVASNPLLTQSGCYSDYCFSITTARAASGNLVIDFNGNNTKDVEDISIYLDLPAGDTCIPWNGKNALGQILPLGTTGIKANIHLFAGRANFVVYDAEFNRKGLKIDQWRNASYPNGRPLTTYWDDSNIPDLNTTSGSQGCLYPASSTSGCHAWVGGAQGAGNNNTMNTWWFAYELRDTVDVLLSPRPVASAGNDTIVCVPNAQVILGGLLLSTPGARYIWRELIPAQTILGSNTSYPTVLNLNNTSQDTVAYELTTTLGTCVLMDTVNVFLQPPTKPQVIGQTSICNTASGVKFWLQDPLSLSAAWTLSSGRTPIVSGDTITVNDWNTLPVPSTETIKVVTNYGIGCPTDSVTLNVQVSNNPVTTGLSGDTVLCYGDTTARLYTLPTSPQGTFVWTVDGVVQPQTSQPLRIKWSSATLRHVVKVLAQSAACTTTPDSLVVNILTPINPLKTEDTLVCQGAVLNFNDFASQLPGSTRYQWAPARHLARPYAANPGFSWDVDVEDSLVYFLTARIGVCSHTDTLIIRINRGGEIQSLSSAVVCDDSTFVVTLKDTLTQSRRWIVNDIADTTKKIGYTTISPSQIKIRWDSVKTRAAVRVIAAGLCKSDTAVVNVAYPRYEKYKPVGDSGFCFSKPITAQYVVRGNGGGRFTWGLDSQPANIGTFVGATANDTIQVTWSGLGTARLWVLETGAEDSLCTVTPDTLNITLTDKGSVDAGEDTSICVGQSVSLTASGGSKYSWNPGNLSGATINVSPAITTSYIVNLLDPCKATDTVVVTVFPLPQNIISDSVLQVCFESSTPLPRLTASSGFTSYLWTPGSSTTNIVDVEKPGNDVNAVTYTVTVKDVRGCDATDSVIINSNCEPRIFVPTAFSPDNNGINESLKVYGSGFRDFEITIYNRWGEVIFVSNNPQQGWDGKYHGQLMAAGVYPWVITYHATNEKYNQVLQRKGSVTLIR